MTGKIPVTVLTGYLGAGKTIWNRNRHLLRRARRAAARLVSWSRS